MASGILLDADKISKEKSKWGEGNKVYIRKFKRTAAPAATVGVVSPSPDQNTDQNLVVEDGNIEKIQTLSLDTAAPIDTVTVVSPPIEISKDQNLVVEDGNIENQPNLVVDVSNDYTGHSGFNGNGAVVKPVFAFVDGVVKINIKSATSKNELLELREKLRGEVDQIRRLGRKLEDKEAELTAYSTVVVGGGGGGDDGDGQAYSHEQYSGSDIVDRRALLRMNSEMGTDYMDRRALMRMSSDVQNGDLRPFRQLSVSIMNNNNHGIGEIVEKEKRTPKANQYYQNSDFLLGKDRLPPESNKRHKSGPGRPGRKPKGYYMGEESQRNQLFRSCNSVLQRLMKHKHGWVFNEPVKAKLLGLHDYFDIIKHPMDLGTVKSRLAQNFYKSPNEFADDVRLTFHNAMTYNPKGQDVHTMAENLLNIFEERWAVIESESNPEMRYGMIYDANTPTPTSRKVPHFAHAPSRMLYRSESVNMPSMTTKPKPPPKVVPPPRTPVPKKPKAKDPNKRNMTYEEKQKLSTNLQSLPSDKLDSIVQIIKKKNTTLSQHDDEIEVDIDSVDVETLWELDRFVQNYKKYVSKHKRKAELAQQARAEAGDNANRVVPQNPAATILEVPNGNKTTGEKTLASAPVDQGEKRGENASSSSSSSSSDSGSSSSDSDSDSSSEDGSPRR